MTQFINPVVELNIRIRECPESGRDAVAFRKEHGLLPHGSNHIVVTLWMRPRLAALSLFTSGEYIYLGVKQVKALQRLQAQQQGWPDREVEDALAALEGAAGDYEEGRAVLTD